jgi:transcriptional regulator with XRE-family HTH domain
MGLLGRCVQERREELGIGQADLATQVGVTQQTISRWENGEVVPPPKRLARLAEALSLDLDRLLGYAGYLSSSPTLSRSQLVKSFYDLIPHLSEEELFVAVECAWGEIRRRLAAGGVADVRRSVEPPG